MEVRCTRLCYLKFPLIFYHVYISSMHSDVFLKRGSYSSTEASIGLIEIHRFFATRRGFVQY